MRKIYSLVLMTAMLFIGANVNAGTVISVSTPDAFASAFTNASTGDTIRLTTDIAQSSYVELNDGRQLVLDMKGHTLTVNYTAKPTYADNFVLKHGKLSVIGGGEIQNATTNTKDYKYDGVAIHGFYVFGTTTPGTEAYTVLEIGAGTFINNVNGKDAIEIYNVSNVAYGVEVYVAGTCFGQKYGVQLSGTVSAAPGKGTIPANATKPQYYFPYIHLQPGSLVYAHENNPDAVGVYSGGYGIWKIEGTVYGSTGVYAKGGKIEINNANVYSTNNTATGVQESKNSGVNAGGNAIATESNGGYAGAISVVISGDSHVTGGTNAYAISDTTTTASESQVAAITITGGDIQGGSNAGAVQIDNSTGDVITVTGGTFTGDIETLITHTADDGASIIQDVVSTDGNGNATVVIGKPAEGSTTPTISPTADDTINFNLAGVSASDIVKLKASATTGNLSYTLSGAGTTEIQYLSLKAVPTKTITVTVAAGHTAKIGQIVMDENAQIVVEVGAKLLVTGSNGIFADSENNLILKANATNQALFVISPEVTTNKQPKAKVEYYTEAYGIPTTGTSTDYKWDRLSSPLSTYSSITNNYATLDPKPALLPGETKLTTWVEQYNETAHQWEGIYYNQMRPFVNYAWSNNAVSGGITYTFAGNLQGNVADNIELDHAGWNYMGNAFLAPVHVKTMLTAIKNSGAGIDNALYLWNMASQSYQPVSTTMYQYFTTGPKEIPAMQTFIVKLISGSSALLDLDYENSVYEYAINPNAAAYSAPQRISTDVNAFRMNITSVNGEEDNVYVVESSEFSADNENGADIVKYMNEGINFYAEGEDKYAMVASDNILGTVFSLQTTEAINYTLTFAEVRGNEYALRDNMNGTVMNIVDGAIYNFYAQPNETIEGRFQIVSRQEMPTAVETVEETVNAPKAIYTVMGQYVGETTDWNNLPAGVYVVDGVKVVK